DLAALFGIEKALEQRPENRRIDLAPIEARRGDEETDIARFEAKRAASIEQATVEVRNLRQVEFAGFLHRGEQAVEIALGIFRIFQCAPKQPWKEAVGKQLDAVREKTEDQLIDEMRDFFRRAPPLQPQRDRRKLVRRLLGNARARLFRPQLFWI